MPDDMYDIRWEQLAVWEKATRTAKAEMTWRLFLLIAVSASNRVY